MARVRLAIALLALSLLQGCQTPTTGVSFEPAVEAPVSLPHGAWLAVRVTDPDAASEIQRALPLTIAAYVDESGYFSRVNLLPGTLGDGDLVLRFEFDRYEFRRESHPAYLPADLLTLGLYSTFGGPVMRDTARLSGHLRVEDAAGNALAEARNAFGDIHDVSLYSRDYKSPTFVAARTNLVRGLIDEVVLELAKASPVQPPAGSPAP
jgi:hypothetical protein